MSLRNNYIAGEQVLAADVNDCVSAIIENQHNIFELALQDYFQSLVTPINGLFFDGFSDTAKTDTFSANITAPASSGQPNVTVSSVTGLSVGKEVDILDVSNGNFETKIISAIVSLTITFTTNLANSYTTAGFVKRTSAIIETTDKRLSMGFNPASTASLDLEQGNNQFAFIEDASQVGLDFAGNLSFAMWIKLESTQAVFDFMVKSQGGAGNKAFIWEYQTATPRFGFTTSSDGDNFNPSLFVNNTLVFGRWYHIAVTKSGTSVKFYVDGMQIGTTQTLSSATIFNAGSRFYIGADNNNATFDGLIQDARAWSRTLTDAEILSLRNNSNAFSNGANLQGWWKFNNVYTDSSGNGNTLTPVNSPVFSTEIPPTSAGNKANYRSIKTAFQQSMETVYLWVVRNFSARFNLAAGISVGATTLTITGDETTKFKSGDTIDIYTSTNLLRERKTLTINSTFAGGLTTLTFSATVNAYTTTSFVERVDVLPEVSLVDSGGNESFVSLTYQKSIVDFTNLEVEDEYKLIATPQEDFIAKLKLSRTTVDVSGRFVYAKRLGCDLTT